MSVANDKRCGDESPTLQYLNPFVHKLEMDNLIDKIKTIIFSVFLLPFRVICICLLLIVAWLLACIGLAGLSPEELRTKPLCGWRRQLKLLICSVGRWSYLAGGMAITIKGRQASRAEAPILCIAPHSTFLDSVIVYVTRMSSVIVRKESMDNYIGKLINYTQPIYVWRDDPNSRQNTIKDIIERANSPEDWPQIIIFPEGTCTNRSCLITFKPGAFYPGVAVQPVCIRYPNKLDTVTWTWEGPGVLTLLWLTLTQVHSSCEIEFLPVYVPSEEEKNNPKLYARNVRNVMSKALGIPVSEYTYEDCQLMTRAKQINLPCYLEVAEVEKLRKRIGLDQTNVEVKIVHSSMVDERNCDVNVTHFAERLEISPHNKVTRTLFSYFDKESTGTIDFRKYLLCALFVINSNEPIQKLLSLAFKLYENRDIGNGCLSRSSFSYTLKHTLALTRVEANNIFDRIDVDERGYATYDEFIAYAETMPEYATMIGCYRSSTIKSKDI